MTDLCKVRMTGPLANWGEGLTAEFLRLGYTPGTAARHVQLMAHLSRWMADQGVSVEGLSWSLIEHFCSDHGLAREHRFSPRNVPRSMSVLMSVLHPDCESPSVVMPRGALSVATVKLLEGFAAYLCDERCLATRTVDGYLLHVRAFAAWHVGLGGSDVCAATVAQVDRFVIGRLTDSSAADALAARTALRALYQWLFLTGRLRWNVAEGIVTVRRRAQTDLPRALPVADVASLLAVDLSTRDRAIILILIRMGLRSSEVSSLSLDDFAWRTATVKIHGKGGDCHLMPIPAQVGEAIAAYLDGHRRANSPHRQVFLASCAPYQPLSCGGVAAVVATAGRRAGIHSRVGPHRLRHSAATAVLANGGTLTEAGQLLRHRGVETTAIYAKVDLGALAQIARPWPDTIDLGPNS